MSKGNRPILVRLEEQLRAKIEEQVRVTGRRRPKLEYTISQFVREAIVEKLAHRERSRKPGPKRIYLCRLCGKGVPLESVATTMQLLGGCEEFTCKECDLGFAS